jgi:hypothetical protein
MDIHYLHPDLRRQLCLHRLRVVHWLLADEMLADVCGGFIVQQRFIKKP